MTPWPDVAHKPKRPYGLYVALVVAVGFIFLHLDTAPFRYFVGVGLLALAAGLFDSETL